MRVVAVTNQKGGVGKTTTAVNMAAAFAATGRKTLLIDLDPQGNATTGSGIDKTEIPFSSYDLLTHNAPLASCAHKTEGNYDLVAGNGDLTAAEIELLSTEDRQTQLKQALEDNPYDIIVIDCPPSAMTGIPSFSAASAVSMTAVNWGMPMPATTRVVQIDPGPMPTLMQSAPAPMSARAASAVAILPATTLTSLLNCLTFVTWSITPRE